MTWKSTGSAATDGTNALNRVAMEDVPMLMWFAVAWLACIAVVMVLAARAPIMDIDPDLEERADRIAEREARLKSRKRGAAPVLKAH